MTDAHNEGEGPEAPARVVPPPASDAALEEEAPRPVRRMRRRKRVEPQESERKPKPVPHGNTSNINDVFGVSFGYVYSREMGLLKGVPEPTTPVERWLGRNIPWDMLHERLGPDFTKSYFTERLKVRRKLPDIALPPALQIDEEKIAQQAEQAQKEAFSAGDVVEPKLQAADVKEEGLREAPQSPFGTFASVTREVGESALGAELFRTEAPLDDHEEGVALRPLDGLDAAEDPLDELLRAVAPYAGADVVFDDDAVDRVGQAEPWDDRDDETVDEDLEDDLEAETETQDEPLDAVGTDAQEEAPETYGASLLEDDDAPLEDDLAEDDETFEPEEDLEDDFEESGLEDDGEDVYDEDDEDVDEAQAPEDMDASAHVPTPAPAPRRTLTIRAGYVPKTPEELLAEEEVRSVITTPLSSVSARLRAQRESRGSSPERMTHQMVSEQKGRRQGPRRNGPMPVLPSDATMSMLWGGGTAEDQNAYGRSQAKKAGTAVKKGKFSKKGPRAASEEGTARAGQKKGGAPEQRRKPQQKPASQDAASSARRTGAQTKPASKKSKRRPNDEMARRNRRERLEAMRLEEREDALELPPDAELSADELVAPFRPKRKPRPNGVAQERREKHRNKDRRPQDADVLGGMTAAPEEPTNALVADGAAHPKHEGGEERRATRLFGRNRTKKKPRRQDGQAGSADVRATAPEDGKAVSAQPVPQVPQDGTAPRKGPKKPNRAHRSEHPRKDGARLFDEAGERMPGADAWASSSFGFSGHAASTYLSGSTLTLPQVTPATDARGFGTVFGSGGQPDNVIRRPEKPRRHDGHGAPRKNGQGKPKRFFKKGSNRNG